MLPNDMSPLARAEAKREDSQQDALRWLIYKHKVPSDIFTMVEVGVYCGETPRQLLPNLPWLHYIGVDPWLPWSEQPDYVDLAVARQQALQMTSQFGWRCRFLELPSDIAEQCFARECVDLVFIDASHNYEAAKAEINHWVGKVKAGGVICGHDYNFQQGVKRAVGEAFDEVNYIGGQADVWWWSC